MTKFTKEQLINLARENVRVLKQAAMQHKVQPVIAMDLRLAEIALAALTAAPTAYIHKAQGDLYRPEYLSEEDANGKRFDPLYRLPLLEGLK